MKVDIIRVADEFDFEQNVTVNFVQFRLPSGRIVRALIGEGDMKAIIEDKVRFANAPPQPVMVAPPQPPGAAPDPGEVSPMPEYTEPIEVTIFGGDGGGEVPEFDQAPGFSPPVPAYPQPQLQRPQPPRPQRVVQKDEAGYPVVRQAGGVNPDDVVQDGDFGGVTAG